MANTIAVYYSDELADWNRLIVFYNREIDQLGQKLSEIIRRDSIIDIAEKVEAHQMQLNHSLDQLYRLQIEIQEQEAVLKTNNSLIDDALINRKIEKQQKALRHKMQTAEKEYIDTKFDCYNFLSETLKK